MPKFYRISKPPYHFEKDGCEGFEEYVYGPFADYAEIDADAIKRNIDKDKHLLVFDAEVRPVARDPREKPEDQKRAPGNEKNWKKVSENPPKWVCKDCGATIMAATVAHPIWDGPGASGSGECDYESVGYCPNCEKKPGFHGAAIISR
jgi:rubrerythrin